MTLGEIVSSTLGALGLIGGLLGFLLSRSAKREAADASEQAVVALTQSAKAHDEMVAALRERNEIARDSGGTSPVPPQVRWVLTNLKGVRWTATNASSVPLENALVIGAGEAPDLVRVNTDGPRTVGIGESLPFVALKVWGPDPVVRIEYTDPATGRPATLERTLT